MEKEKSCPKCRSKEYHKSGKAKGKQRYKCIKCGCHFTKSEPRGMGIEIKLKAFALYREGMGFRAIGRLLKVSNVSVLKWIGNFGKEIEEKMSGQICEAHKGEIIVMDELWHYTKKNDENYGYGLLCLFPRESSLPLRWALVVPKQLKDFGVK